MSGHIRRDTQRGFTLLELIVAIAIFAIVGALALGGYNELVRQSDRVDKNTRRTRAVQATVHRMAQDFASLEPRPVREPLGDSLQPALRSDARTELLAEFTHSGWSNPAGVSRPTLQRVAYRLDNKRLRRDYWVVLDRTLNTEPVSTVLLDRVTSVKLRFMDRRRAWRDQWPQTGVVGQDPALLLPIAVEVTLELEDWGKITRLVEVAG